MAACMLVSARRSWQTHRKQERASAQVAKAVVKELEVLEWKLLWWDYGDFLRMTCGFPDMSVALGEWHCFSRYIKARA